MSIGLLAGLPLLASAVFIATPSRADDPDASCVARSTDDRAGLTQLSGRNGCGIPVQYNLCATVPGAAQPYRFSVTLEPSQPWTYSFANPSARQSTIRSDYCRIGQSCPVSCLATQAAGVVWRSIPSLEDDFPQAALRQGVGGKVVLSCVIAPSYRPTDCAVVSEENPGFGLGDAAMRMARRYLAQPTTADGKPAIGQRTEIKMNFTTPR